jgi:hypothetical protein
MDHRIHHATNSRLYFSPFVTQHAADAAHSEKPNPCPLFPIMMGSPLKGEGEVNGG